MRVCCHTFMHLRGLDLVVQVQVFVTMRGNQAQLVADYTRRVPRGVLSDVQNFRNYDLMDPRNQELGQASGENRQPVAGPSTAPDRPVVAVRHQEVHEAAVPAAQERNQGAGSPLILVPETDSDTEVEPSDGSTVAAPLPGDQPHNISVESIITILSDSTLPSIIGPTEGDTSSTGGNGGELDRGVTEEVEDLEREEVESEHLQQEEEGEASGLARGEEEEEEIESMEGQGEERQEEEEEVELGREEGETSRAEQQEEEESEEEVSEEQMARRREVMAREWAIMERMDREEEEQRKRMLEEGTRRRMRRRLMEERSGSDDNE